MKIYMRTLLLLMILCSASAHALTLKSPTRVLKMNFYEDTVIIKLCNLNGEGCLNDKISSKIVQSRVETGIKELEEIVNNPAIQNKVKERMIRQIEETGKSFYKIPGLATMTADSIPFLDHLFSNVLPDALEKLQDIDTSAVFDLRAVNYYHLMNKNISVSKEKEFGEFLDNLFTLLLVELK